MDIQDQLAREHASNLILGDTGPPEAASIIVSSEIDPLPYCDPPFCKLTSQPVFFDWPREAHWSCSSHSESGPDTDDDAHDAMGQRSRYTPAAPDSLEPVVLLPVANPSTAAEELPMHKAFLRQATAAQHDVDHLAASDAAARNLDAAQKLHAHSHSPPLPSTLSSLFERDEDEAEEDGDEIPDLNFDIDLAAETASTTPERYSEDLPRTPPGFAWEPMPGPTTPRAPSRTPPHTDGGSILKKHNSEETSTYLLKESLVTPTVANFPRLGGPTPNLIYAAPQVAQPESDQDAVGGAPSESDFNYSSSDWTDTDSTNPDSRADLSSLGGFSTTNHSTSTIESFDRGYDTRYAPGHYWLDAQYDYEDASVPDDASIAESELSTDTQSTESLSMASTHRISPLTLPPMTGESMYFAKIAHDPTGRGGSNTPSHLESRSSFAEDATFGDGSRRDSVTTRGSLEDEDKTPERPQWTNDLELPTASISYAKTPMQLPKDRPHTAETVPSPQNCASPSIAKQQRGPASEGHRVASSPNNIPRQDSRFRSEGMPRFEGGAPDATVAQPTTRVSPSADRQRADQAQSGPGTPGRSPASTPWTTRKLLASPLLGFRGQLGPQKTGREKSGSEGRTVDGLKPPTQALKLNAVSNLGVVLPAALKDEMFGPALPKMGLGKVKPGSPSEQSSTKRKDAASSAKASASSKGFASRSPSESPPTRSNGALTPSRKGAHDSRPDGTNPGLKAKTKKPGLFFGRGVREPPKHGIDTKVADPEAPKEDGSGGEMDQRRGERCGLSTDESDEEQTPPATPSTARNASARGKVQVGADEDDADKWSVYIISPDRNLPGRADSRASREQVVANGPRHLPQERSSMGEPSDPEYQRRFGSEGSDSERGWGDDDASSETECWTMPEGQELEIESALDDRSEVDVRLPDSLRVKEAAPVPPMLDVGDCTRPGQALGRWQRSTASLSTIMSGETESTIDQGTMLEDGVADSVLALDQMDLQQALSIASRARTTWDRADAAAHW